MADQENKDERVSADEALAADEKPAPASESKSEPPKSAASEPPKSAASKSEPPKSESPKSAASKSEPPKSESPKSAASKSESPKSAGNGSALSAPALATAGAPHAVAAHTHGEHHGLAHTTPVWLLLSVLGALLVLTVLTVSVTSFDLGSQGNLVVAMIIATVKAGLVVSFFMHLVWDKKLHLILFLTSVLFLVLFLSLSVNDRGEYQHDIDAYTNATQNAAQ